MDIKDLFKFTRTKPDGKHGLGFGVILLVMGVTVIFLLYTAKVVKWAPKRETGVKIATPSSERVRKGGNPVAKPFVLPNSLAESSSGPQGSMTLERAYRQSEMQKAEEKANEEAATNDPSKGWIPVVHPNDLSVDTSAQAQVGPGHLTTDPMLRQRMRLQRGNQGNQGNNNGTGATTGPLNVSSPYGPNIIDGQSLDGIKFYYVDELVAVKEPQAPKQGSMSGFATHHFLPRGYRIPVILIDRINTSLGTLPVEMAVAKDVEWNGRLQIPFGWRIFGTASAGTGVKVNVRANMILDPVGKEYPITGLVLNTALEPGFDGYPTPDPLLLQLLPIAQQTIGTFMSAAQDTTTQPTLVSGGALGTSTLSGSQQVYTLDAKNSILQGTAQALTMLMNQKVQELQKLYPQGEIVERGSLGLLLVTSPLDLNLGRIAGSTNFLTKEEATPTPNSISIKQQQQFVGPNTANLNQLINQAQNAVPGLNLNSLTPTVPAASANLLQPSITLSPAAKGLE